MIYIYLLIILISLPLFAKLFVKLTIVPLCTYTCLQGKTALVTGGNSGIGYQIVLELASRGCKVIIADKDNCELSKRKIIHQTGNHNVTSRYLDLGSLESVRKFASDFKDTNEKLDILINNAGAAGFGNVKSKDGLDKLMQVNYFGPFLLTHLLIGSLKESTGRIVFTSSILAYISKMDLDDLNGTIDLKIPYLYDLLDYANSKLCILIASKEFARKLDATGITCNAVHPGNVRTNIFKSYAKNIHPLFGILVYIGYLASSPFMCKTSREGAFTTLKVALSKKYAKTTGKLFMECQPVSVLPRKLKNEEFTRKLWKLSETLVQLKDAEKLLY